MEGRSLAAIERRVGGRVGVFAIDTATGRSLDHRADERFPLCSTFKWVLAAAVLQRVDRRDLSLDDRVAYGRADLVEHAPVTGARAEEGGLTVAELCHAAVTVSDNAAANLLLARIGGPAGLTAFARAQGDAITRLVRDEPSLNEWSAGDDRDTTSPRAMASLLRRVVCGDALSAPRRDQLRAWLTACETGKDRLRAGLPARWAVGHKTGTGPRGSAHDVAVAWPPGRAPLILACYLSGSDADPPALARAHAAVGALVASAL